MGNVTRRLVFALCAVALAVSAGCGAPIGGRQTATPTVTATATPGTPTGTPATPGATQTAGPPVTPPDSALAVEQTNEKVIAAVLPSIVQITTKTGLGSGVIYDTAGHIITNAHVVGGARTFQVTPATGGSPRDAVLVEAFSIGDLAVIKVSDARGLIPARFGDSGELRVGQMVLAMGNPLGLSGSVTNGIVSALGRTVSEPESSGTPGATITNAVQTSAAINPGNSGGALVNLQGEVIGIPTLAATNPELGGGAAPGIGFAIPSSTVTDIANQIITQGKVSNTRRAALGVTVSGAVGADGSPAGVNIVRVAKGGGADQAGIRAGDIVLSVNGTETLTVAALSEVLATLKPGQTAKVKVMRPDGSTQTVDVKLSELPSD
ncbi:trypsin-like peptidase domain-containing protein [Spongiactinospora sp. TRM90649]|uniref:S1C family serine protease n=1 Tax=Spongiactinospora sp. TRM90649 TaxID=3031114 RepID=UPI0023F78FBA|nr:trypsin-like peptidase domain-containing protein [Spongiactinospora sp. TRM90649]MDF5751067.1 trypsin-like peptidase domain-containing protein [Spongiactinospora sp. TRM90649]